VCSSLTHVLTSGFIGSLLVEELVRLGHAVTVLDNFSHCKCGVVLRITDTCLKRRTTRNGPRQDYASQARFEL
jgi:nucleoside-diphosphate-sugar epimerase